MSKKNKKNIKLNNEHKNIICIITAVHFYYYNSQCFLNEQRVEWSHRILEETKYNKTMIYLLEEMK